ncbi:lipoprotein [Roseibium aquae]|uniref:lipoprotein n=1 Tax=Roseibium aquae TaxID=1323746 RepID=UPI003CC7C95E
MNSAGRACLLVAVSGAILLGGCGRKGGLEDPRSAPDAISQGVDPATGAAIEPLPSTEPRGFVLDPLIR